MPYLPLDRVRVSLFPRAWMAWVLVSLLWVGTRPVAAQETGLRTVRGAGDAEQGLALTVSGGVSKGSYQGGFSYGLTHVMRLSREREPLTPAFDVPDYHLVSATGASAGNINALLAAIAWCDAAFLDQTPRESLFWRVWIPVGVEQLFPETRPADPEIPELVFSRQFFHTEVIPRLKQAMRHPARPDCEVPVGLTLTRIDALGRVPLAPDLDPVRTIRYASIARLGTGQGATGTGMRFRPFDFTGLDPQQYGELLLPDLAPTADDSLGVEAMVQVALGSSAFPIAFAPVRISFFPSPGAPLETGYFIDGGVFDNNPLGLSDALYNPRPIGMAPETETELRMQVRRPAADDGTTETLPVSSLLVNQNHRRKPSRRAPPAPMVRDARNRISVASYSSFVNKAVTTAREYEMELLARDLTEDERGRIQQSSRYHAFTGESLQSFGAFLSYLFRQHDFFVGLYDALHFVAEESVPDRLDSDEIGRRVLAIIEALAPTMDDEDEAFLRSLHADEFGDGRDCSPYAVHENIYITISCATSQWESDVGPVDRSSVAGLRYLFRSLDAFIDPATFLRLERDACLAEQAASPGARRQPRVTAEAFRCDAIANGGLLQQLRGQTGQALTRILESALEILLENERAIERAGYERGARAAITFVYFLQRNIAIEQRTGLSWDSSSMPVERARRRGVDAPLISRRLLWRTVVPNEVIFPVARKGWGMSYRPRFYPGPRRMPRVPLLLGYNKYEGQPGLFLAGIGLQQPIFTGARRLILSSIEVGVTQGIATTGTGNGSRYTGLNAGLYVLGGKIRFGILLPSLFRHPSNNRYSEHQTSVGISDVNGLLYWIGKFIR